MLINYIRRHRGGDGYSYYYKDKQAAHSFENNLLPSSHPQPPAMGSQYQGRWGLCTSTVQPNHHQPHVANEHFECR